MSCTPARGTTRPRLVPAPIGRQPFDPDATRARTATASSPAGSTPVRLRIVHQPARRQATPIIVTPDASLLEALGVAPWWHQLAECRGMDVNLFFPPPGRPPVNRAKMDAAKAVCSTCAVISECRQASIGERFGVWGGLTEKDRRADRRLP